MRNFPKIFAVAVLALTVGSAGQAQAGIVLNFQQQLQPTTPAPGWSYLYNTGAISDVASYAPLIATTDSIIYYDKAGNTTLPNPDGSYTFFGKDSSGQAIGHPGFGTTQATFEGFAIAAYTLSTDAQDVTIANGILTNIDHSNDGLDLRVFLKSSLTSSSTNSSPVYTRSTASGLGSSTGFGVDLGSALAGDTIYVAVGSGGNHYNDAFHLNYDVAIATPEPSTIVSLSIAGLLSLGYAWRRRKAKSVA